MKLWDSAVLERAGFVPAYKSVALQNEVRTCTRCGEDFTAQSGRQIYCGAACRVADSSKGTSVFLVERLAAVTLAAIAAQPGISKRELRCAVAGRGDAKDLALQLCEEQGLVRIEKNGRRHQHWLTEAR